MTQKQILKEIFLFFFKLGTLGFGGPLALISQMQKEIVQERKWITDQEFNSAFSMIKAMPGPVAFMVAVFLGRHRAGFFGGLLAALGLVLPPSVLMILFSIGFSSLSHFKATSIILMGMQVCALGVILGSLKGLIKGQIKGQWQDLFFWLLVFISGLINFYIPSFEPLVILSLGLMMIFFKKSIEIKFFGDFSLLLLLGIVCFKAGALVFGSGLAIVPMLKNDVVNHYHWLSDHEFLDALAFGQMTPGPVVVTATYIGHRVHGISGALVATVSIFSASFFHMVTWFPRMLKKLNSKKWINDFIFGAVAAVTGPILVTVLKLFSGILNGSINGPWQIVLLCTFFVISMLLTYLAKLPLWAIIPGGGVCFYFVKLFF